MARISSRVTWLVLLCGMTAARHVLAQSQVDLAQQVDTAEKLQSEGKQIQNQVVSSIVESAGAAELSSGDGDVDTTKNCKADIKYFCSTVKPGEGRLSLCLKNQIEEEEKGSVTGRKTTAECREELQQFMMDRATNINKDLPLATACKVDAEMFCNASNIYPEPGAVLTCLREVKDKLTEKCKEEVTRTQIDASKNFKVDAMLNELCTADAEALCAGIPNKDGAVQDCLRGKRAQLSWDCQEELFRQEVENADDIRLSAKLLRTCMRDKKKFCNDVKPGNARVKACLEDKKEDPEFSAECKKTFEEMMARRATDFRLDAKLRDLCKADIEEVCGYEKDSLDSIAGYDGRVLECLQDYKDELVTPACKKRVHKLTMRAAQDIRMDRPLSDACFDDRQKLCANIQPGDARVLRCLQDSREQLTYECRATLFDQEVRLAEDIDFQFPLKKACAAEIPRFCKDVQHGGARVIQCLILHDEETEMSDECRTEVKRHETRAAKDYRLNYRLNKACDLEIDRLCADVCSPFSGQACEGTVIQCLTQKADNITDQACKKEIFIMEKIMANDVRADAVLQKACDGDIATYCSDVEAGKGRVHQCLRNNRDKLSKQCAAEELKLNIIQSSDIRLRPGFKDCSEEMNVYCKDVKPGKGRMFLCLQNNIAKVDFSQACKARVEEKQTRQQNYYMLDFGVRSACKITVDKLCSSVKGSGHGKAAVLKCLVEKHAAIAESQCANEISRATRMAIWQYRKGAALTQTCDADVDKFCKGVSTSTVGAIGRCLAKQVTDNADLTTTCKKLVMLAAPKDAKSLFDGEMTTAAVVSKVEEIEKKAGLTAALIKKDKDTGSSMVTLTGWIALVSIAALIVVIIGAVVYTYRKYTGQDKPYTLVVKGGDV